jgi:TrmH family RNA methyltransferase
MTWTDSFRIVLIEPQESLNVGSVARAMSNMGFHRLALVSPRGLDLDKARVTACHGAGLLSSVEQYGSIEDCLASSQVVVGFSGQHGKHRPAHVTLSEWVESWESRNQDNQIALMFGPEDTGLRMEHLAHCRWTVRIPSSDENASLNLAQAVLVVLYELQRRKGFADLSVEASSQNAGGIRGGEKAPAQLHYQLDRLVQEVLDEAGFYREGTPAPIPDLVKNLFRRIEPDQREIGVLLALFSRVASRLRAATTKRAGEKSAEDNN